MHANDAAFAPDDETAFAAAGACCSAGAGACSSISGARCNSGDAAIVSDVAAHLAHMDATLQLLAKNE